MEMIILAPLQVNRCLKWK